MTGQVNGTRKSGGAIKKALGAILCYLGVAWLLMMPVSLQASEEICSGICDGSCGAYGLECWDYEYEVIEAGWMCTSYCS